MSTTVHLLLALVLTSFVVFQAASLAIVVRYRRARLAARPPRRMDLVWSSIPIVIVLFLAARSWVAVLDLERPAVASAVTRAELTTPRGGTPR